MTHKLNSAFIVDREHGRQDVSCTFRDGVDLETHLSPRISVGGECVSVYIR